MTFEEKHKIVYFNNKRRHIIDLSERRYDLEHTAPAYFKLYGEEMIHNSWGALLEEVTNYLIDDSDYDLEKIRSFKTTWSKALIFTDDQVNKVSKKLNCGLYINLNHTSLHSVWLLQDLLEFFNIDLKFVELIIKKLPKAESEEIQKFYIKQFKMMFSDFLIKEIKKSPESAEKFIKNIDFINKYFCKSSPSYVNLFLVDEYVILGTLKAKLISYYYDNLKPSDKLIKVTNDCFNLYSKFLYRFIK